MDGADASHDLTLPEQHFVTHGAVVGTTGSGETGLVTVSIEAAKAVPTIVIGAEAFAEERPAKLAGWRIGEHDRDLDLAPAVTVAQEAN